MDRDLSEKRWCAEGVRSKAMEESWGGGGVSLRRYRYTLTNVGDEMCGSSPDATSANTIYVAAGSCWNVIHEVSTQRLQQMFPLPSFCHPHYGVD